LTRIALGKDDVSISAANPSGEWYERALAYYRAGNFVRSRECAEEALANDSRNVPSLILKGMALIELDQPEDAVGPLKAATSAAPDNPDAWRHFGIALVSAGDREAALSALQHALRLQPENVAALTDVGNLLFGLERSEAALETLERARRLAVGDLPILRNLADMYASMNRHDEALRTTREILDLRPDDVVACGDAAALCLQLERFDEAAELFRTMRRIDPSQEHEIFAVHGLVMTEIRRGDWRRAMDFVIEATRLDRCDLTTNFLAYTSGRLFGTSTDSQIPLEELATRFETGQREHRRLHAEAQT
jgi:tetratricopeptide (TPR) repeat protein